jgi:hypothetical protein
MYRVRGEKNEHKNIAREGGKKDCSRYGKVSSKTSFVPIFSCHLCTNQNEY